MVRLQPSGPAINDLLVAAGVIVKWGRPQTPWTLLSSRCLVKNDKRGSCKQHLLFLLLEFVYQATAMQLSQDYCSILTVICIDGKRLYGVGGDSWSRFGTAKCPIITLPQKNWNFLQSLSADALSMAVRKNRDECMTG